MRFVDDIDHGTAASGESPLSKLLHPNMNGILGDRHSIQKNFGPDNGGHCQFSSIDGGFRLVPNIGAEDSDRLDEMFEFDKDGYPTDHKLDAETYARLKAILESLDG